MIDEPRGLGAEVVAPGGGDAIVLGAPPVLGHAPLASDVSAVLQAVQRLEQRRIVDLNAPVGPLFAERLAQSIASPKRVRRA